MKATDCLRLESMDFARKHSDGKDAVFSVNSGRGFVGEQIIEPGIEKKVKEGVTGCQDTVSRLGKMEQ